MFSMITRSCKRLRSPQSTASPKYESLAGSAPLKDERQTFMKDGLFTPETLSPFRLAVNLYYAVAFGYTDPPLMERYANRGIVLIKSTSMLAKDIAMLCSSLARANYQHEEFLKTYAQKMLGKLDKFTTHDLANVCHAYAKFLQPSQVEGDYATLFHRLSEEIPHKLEAAKPNELANIALAFAKLRILDSLLFDDIGVQVVQQKDRFDGQALTLTIRAFSYLRNTHQRRQFWKVCLEGLVARAPSMNTRCLLVSLQSLARAQVWTFQTLDVLRDELLQIFRENQHLKADEPLDEFDSFEVSTATQALSAFAKLGYFDEEFYQSMASFCAGKLDLATPVQVSQLILAFARCAQPLPSPLFMERGLDLLKKGDTRTLATLVYSAGLLGDRDLITQAIGVIQKNVKDITPHGIALIVYSFAKSGSREQVLFYLLAQEIVQNIELYTPQGLGMLLYGFGKLELWDDNVFKAVRRSIMWRAREITGEELVFICRALNYWDNSVTDELRELLQCESIEGSELADPSID